MTHSYGARKFTQDFLSCTTKCRNRGMNQPKFQLNDCEWEFLEEKLISRPSTLKTRIAFLQFSSFPLGPALSEQDSNFHYVEFRLWGPALPAQATRISSVKQGGIICDYLLIIWNYLFFQRLFGLFVDYFSENVPYFCQDYLRLFEIVDHLHYLQLF